MIGVTVKKLISTFVTDFVALALIVFALDTGDVELSFWGMAALLVGIILISLGAAENFVDDN